MRLHAYLGDKFSDFYEPQFSRSLADITCVPGEQFGTNTIVLRKFKEMLVPKDKHLGKMVV